MTELNDSPPQLYEDVGQNERLIQLRLAQAAQEAQLVQTERQSVVKTVLFEAKRIALGGLAGLREHPVIGSEIAGASLVGGFAVGGVAISALNAHRR